MEKEEIIKLLEILKIDTIKKFNIEYLEHSYDDFTVEIKFDKGE